jgi:hypothetical protein
MLIKKEDVIMLIYAERDAWYGSGQDCMGAEQACDNILKSLDKWTEGDNDSANRA